MEYQKGEVVHYIQQTHNIHHTLYITCSSESRHIQMEHGRLENDGKVKIWENMMRRADFQNMNKRSFICIHYMCVHVHM